MYAASTVGLAYDIAACIIVFTLAATYFILNVTTSNIPFEINSTHVYLMTVALELGVGNYSINRENCDNLVSNNRIVSIFLVFNNRTSQ